MPKDSWLDDGPARCDVAESRRRAVLFQLCSKGVVWQTGNGYVYCVIACGNTSLQQAAELYNKFFRILYIQGIIDNDYEAGAYPHDSHAFEIRLSETQLKKMQHYYLGVLRQQSRHTD